MNLPITQKVGRFLPKGWPQVPSKAKGLVSLKTCVNLEKEALRNILLVGGNADGKSP
jgi:hypothetical protein